MYGTKLENIYRCYLLVLLRYKGTFLWIFEKQNILYIFTCGSKSTNTAVSLWLYLSVLPKFLTNQILACADVMLMPGWCQFLLYRDNWTGLGLELTFGNTQTNAKGGLASWMFSFQLPQVLFENRTSLMTFDMNKTYLYTWHITHQACAGPLLALAEMFLNAFS